MSLMVKPVGEPDAGNPHVRFDERGRETGPCSSHEYPRPSSTLLNANGQCLQARCERGCRLRLLGQPVEQHAARKGRRSVRQHPRPSSTLLEDEHFSLARFFSPGCGAFQLRRSGRS